MNSRKETTCPGMWIELKGSDDCFATSIYTIDPYASDLKDVFTAAVKYQNQLPLLYSIDWYDHTFVQNISSLKDELADLSKKENSLKNQISELLSYIEASIEKAQGKHSAFLFNGM